MNDEVGDTRKLLKVFGVAVTMFEEQSAELVERLDGNDGSEELLPAIRDLLRLLIETNEKWQAVTDHLFEGQRRVIGQLADRLGD